VEKSNRSGGYAEQSFPCLFFELLANNGRDLCSWKLRQKAFIAIDSD